MPERTLAYLVLMTVPVVLLFVLNVLQLAPSAELKAALATFTATGAGLLGHGFVRDTRRINAAMRRSDRKVAAVVQIHEAHAPSARVHPDSGSEAAATTRIERNTIEGLEPGESTP